VPAAKTGARSRGSLDAISQVALDLIKQLTKIIGGKRADFDEDPVGRAKPQIAAANGKFITDKGNPAIFHLLLGVPQILQFARDNRFKPKRCRCNQFQPSSHKRESQIKRKPTHQHTAAAKRIAFFHSNRNWLKFRQEISGESRILAQQQIHCAALLLAKVRRGLCATSLPLTVRSKAGLGRIEKYFLTVNQLGIAVTRDVLRPPILARLVRLCQNRACRGIV